MNCNNILKSLVTWFKNEAVIEKNENTCIINLPLERADGDMIEIYVTEKDGKYYVSDGGKCFQYLFLSGVDFKHNAKNIDEINVLSDAYKIQTDFSELFAESTEGNLPQTIFNLFHVYQGISYLQYTVKEKISREFKDDVKIYLEDSGIDYYKPNETVEGLVERHKIHFLISQNGGGILLQTIRANNDWQARATSERIAYWWIDIKRKNEEKYKYFTVIDDTVQGAKNIWYPDIISIFNEFDFNGKWSKKRELIEEIESVF